MSAGDVSAELVQAERRLRGVQLSIGASASKSRYVGPICEKAHELKLEVYFAHTLKDLCCRDGNGQDLSFQR